MHLRALVIGASGLVGGALVRVLELQGAQVVGTAHAHPAQNLRSLDMTDPGAVRALIAEVEPEVVFLPAALTNVEYCEEHPQDAFAANVAPVRAIATQVAARQGLLVYYSTDYVFDGADGPYDEAAVPNPVSVYGRTKLAAEQSIQESGVRHLILRTTGVYGWDRGSKNFAMQIWRRLSNGETVQVPCDQIGNPTLVDYLAEVSVRLVQEGAEGIINVVGRDRLARSDFATVIARGFGLDKSLIQPVPTHTLQQAAQRPLNGGLITDRLHALLGTEAMPLDEALKRLRRQWRTDTHQTGAPITVAEGETERLKHEILDKVQQYFEVVHRPAEFVPFKSRIQYAGRVFGAEEMRFATDAVLDFWLTLGPWGDSLEKGLREFVGARDVALVNSGSSANLTAVATLTSPLLDRPLLPGDEVLTPAVTFPTTLAPLVQHGLIPVFVDAEVGTYNVNPDLLEAAISPKTRAMMLPHTLGNPFNLDVVCDLARRYNLYLIEDACDALGSEWNGKRVGGFGDLATLSFYPAHHMTMGEGGAVLSNSARYSSIVRSVRDWGRDCWCAPGESNSCGKRFGWCVGELPRGYDHKYTYSQLGYNLKPTDIQAAIGVAQLHRVEGFVERRRTNFDRLYAGLSELSDYLVLPRAEPQAKPAWFGFPITVQNGVERRALVGWLEESNIETREVFSGNILRQPGYGKIPRRVPGALDESDRIMRDTFFVGVYPGLTDAMLDFMVDRFRAFFANRSNR